MKSLIALLAILLVSRAQHPVPIPSVNINELIQDWYVVWTFNSYNNYNQEFSCYEMSFLYNSDDGYIEIIERISIIGMKSSHFHDAFVNSSSTTSWSNGFNWIALDPISQSWATIGVIGQDYKTRGFILSKNPTLSSTVIEANVALLKGEQFPVLGNNTNSVTNTNCGNFVR